MIVSPFESFIGRATYDSFMHELSLNFLICIYYCHLCMTINKCVECAYVGAENVVQVITDNVQIAAA